MANLLKRSESDEVTYSNIDVLTPAGKIIDVSATNIALIDGAPVCVKDHRSWATFDHREYDRVIYLYRNGIDALLSYWHFSRQQRPGYYRSQKDFCRTYWAYCGHWGDHVLSWMDEAHDAIPVHLVSYERLKADTHGALMDVLSFLRLPELEARLPGAIAASSFERMKQLPNVKEFMRAKTENANFVRGGRTNEGVVALPPECVQIFLSHPRNVHAMNRLNYDIPPLESSRETRLSPAFDVVLERYLGIRYRLLATRRGRE